MLNKPYLKNQGRSDGYFVDHAPSLNSKIGSPFFLLTFEDTFLSGFLFIHIIKRRNKSKHFTCTVIKLRFYMLKVSFLIKTTLYIFCICTCLRLSQFILQLLFHWYWFFWTFTGSIRCNNGRNSGILFLCFLFW